MAAAVEKMMDRTFSFHFRVTSAGLMVSRIQATVDEKLSNYLVCLDGMYTRCENGDMPNPNSSPGMPIMANPMPVVR